MIQCIFSDCFQTRQDRRQFYGTIINALAWGVLGVVVAVILAVVG